MWPSHDEVLQEQPQREQEIDGRHDKGTYHILVFQILIEGAISEGVDQWTNRLFHWLEIDGEEHVEYKGHQEQQPASCSANSLMPHLTLCNYAKELISYLNNFMAFKCF